MTERRLVTRVAAYGLVLRKGRILLCRMSDRVPADAGLWTLPGGGLDFGEDPAEAMVREVFEETGLHVRPRDIAGIDSVRFEEEARTLHGIRILYRTELLGGTLRYEVDGSTDMCAWWTLDDATKLPLVELVEVGLGIALPES